MKASLSPVLGRQESAWYQYFTACRLSHLILGPAVVSPVLAIATHQKSSVLLLLTPALSKAGRYHEGRIYSARVPMQAAEKSRTKVQQNTGLLGMEHYP